MPFDSALSAGELISLRGDSSTPPVYRSTVYLSVNANTNVYTARINQSEFLYPASQLTYDGGSGVLGDVEPGMTVLISATNDRAAAYFRGRVRKDPTADTLYINETGSIGFADDDYIFILDDFDNWEKQPVDFGGTTLVDFDVSFRQLLPIISNLKSAYVGFVDTGTNVLTIAFAPDVTAAADGAAISSYLWDVQDGTITAGVSTDKNITATFPPGERWVYFTATDSNGNALTRRIKVWSHDTGSDAPTPLEVGDLTINCDIPLNVNEGASEGYNASIAAFDNVSSILDQTLVCVWLVQEYNGVETDIGSAGNIVMLGRFRQEDNITAYELAQQDASMTWQIEGVLTQLGRLRIPPLEILNNTSPTTFNEIDDLTPERAMWLLLTEYSTFATLHSLVFSAAITDETYLYGPGLTTQGGDLLYSVADIAQSINAVFQHNACGECEIVRRGNIIDTADRSALTTVADWTTQDYLSLQYQRDYVDLIGLLEGAGGSYNSVSGFVNTIDVRAPRGAPAGGAARGQLFRQILEADAAGSAYREELEVRAGHAFAAQQAPTALPVTMPDGYHWLTPSADQWYTWSIAATDTVRGKVYDDTTRWWLQSINTRHNVQDGTKEVLATFVEETSGAPGEAITYPTLDTGSFSGWLGDFDIPLIPLPASSDNEVADDLSLWTANNGTLSGGDWNEDCDGGQNYIDIERDLGDVVTIKTLSITYSASASIPGTLNYVAFRIAGNSFHGVSAWNTVAGINQTITFDYGDGITTQFINIRLYADDDACVDTASISAISFTEITSEEVDTFTVNYNDASGVDSNIILEADQFYRIRIEGLGSLGAANPCDACYLQVGGNWLFRPGRFTYGARNFNASDWLNTERDAVNHAYTARVLGTGGTVNIKNNDSFYGDNTGQVTVTISRE